MSKGGRMKKACRPVVTHIYKSCNPYLTKSTATVNGEVQKYGEYAFINIILPSQSLLVLLYRSRSHNGLPSFVHNFTPACLV
jgi:hypothetical protein